MADILFTWMTMAATASMAMPIKNRIIEILTIQSSPVERAAWLNKWALVGYIGTLFIVAVMTLVSWWAGSHLQDVIQRQADARIKEADRRGAEALENAGKANERAGIANAEAARANVGLAQANLEIAQLTTEAEQAKTERAEADKQIAIAKADAVRAREGIANAEARSLEAAAEVSRLRVTVANAERERAVAQKALLELQEQVRPRRLTADQSAKLLEILKSGPKGKVTFEIFVGDREAGDFLDEIAQVLVEAGWITSGGAQNVESPPRGIGIFVHSKDSPPPFAVFLQDALKAIGLDAEAHMRKDLATDIVLLYVGPKP